MKYQNIHFSTLKESVSIPEREESPLQMISDEKNQVHFDISLIEEDFPDIEQS